jgi:hypothetical protein
MPTRGFHRLKNESDPPRQSCLPSHRAYNTGKLFETLLHFVRTNIFSPLQLRSRSPRRPFLAPEKSARPSTTPTPRSSMRQPSQFLRSRTRNSARDLARPECCCGRCCHCGVRTECREKASTSKLACESHNYPSAGEGNSRLTIVMTFPHHLALGHIERGRFSEGFSLLPSRSRHTTRQESVSSRSAAAARLSQRAADSPCAGRLAAQPPRGRLGCLAARMLPSRPDSPRGRLAARLSRRAAVAVSLRSRW